MKRQILAILALTIFALSAVAQSADEPVNTDPVRGIFIESSQTLITSNVDTRGPEIRDSAPTISPEDGCREEGEISKIQADNSFRFIEESDQAGCIYAYFNLQVPAGAREITVNFDANRIIHESVNQDIFVKRFIQTIGVSLPGEYVPFSAVSYFDTTAGPADMVAHKVTLPLPENQDEIELVWFFHDNMPSPNDGAVSGTGISFASWIRAPTIQFPQQHLDAYSWAYEGNQTVGNKIHHTTLVRVSPMEERSTAAGQVIIISVDPRFNLANISLPRDNGLLTREDVLETADINERSYHLPPEVSALGGTYEFRFTSTTDAPVIIDPRSRAIPDSIPLIGMAIPALAGVAATVVTHRFRRESGGKRFRQVAQMVIMLLLFWAATAAYFFFVFRQGGLQDMIDLPLSRDGTIFWGILGILTVLFIFHWLLGMTRHSSAKNLAFARQLAAANQKLRASNQELEQFAYVASHDLQEPLRKVVGYTNLLEHRYSDKLDDRGRGYVKEATSQAIRMRGLIQDVLSFSRINSSLEKEHVNFREIVDAVCKDIPDELAVHEPKVEFYGVEQGWGSPRMVRQLFENLIGNAIKYRKPDVAPHVVIRAVKHDNHIEIFFRDNGIGIAPEYTDKVFALFERLHGADSAYKGTGIGLSMCKKIVEAHGGTIGLNSTLGEGSTFFFTLPLEDS